MNRAQVNEMRQSSESGCKYVPSVKAMISAQWKIISLGAPKETKMTGGKQQSWREDLNLRSSSEEHVGEKRSQGGRGDENTSPR